MKSLHGPESVIERRRESILAGADARSIKFVNGVSAKDDAVIVEREKIVRQCRELFWMELQEASASDIEGDLRFGALGVFGHGDQETLAKFMCCCDG